MSSHPPDSFPYQGNDYEKVTEVSVLIDGAAIKQTIPTDPNQVSGNEVQSFVIVNDIDVEEELSKAQKDKDNTNFFKVLSMSFYSKVKSHSVDNQETREHRNVDTPKDSLKSMLPRKSSAYTASESKKAAYKKEMAKQRTQEALKRTGLPIKDFQIPAERFKKRLISPKEEAVKVYSPPVNGPKYQIGNFLGKSVPKREMTAESQTRQQEKEEARNNQKTSASPYLKTQTGRSDSPKYNFKKASSFKIPRGQSKPLINNTKAADEPSALDIPVQEHDRREKSYDVGDKESKPNSKQSSRRSSIKAGLNGTPNNSGRSLPSSASNFQLKNALKKEMKAVFFDTRFKHNFFASSSENSSNTTTKKNTEIQRGKKAMKQKGQKASSQGAKPATGSGEKIRNWNIPVMDLPVPEIKVSVYESEGEKQEEHSTKDDLSPQKNHIARSKDRNQSYKLERQRSPVIGKHNERIPSGMTTSGIGSWGINDVLIGRESLNLRGGSQKESNNNNQSIDTKSKKSSTTSLKESAAKSKTNSTEKLTKSSIYSQMKGGKGSDGVTEQTRESYSLKHDIYELLKSKDEKAFKIFEAYEKRKETQTKNRAVSPMLAENHKNPFELYEKLSAHKKISREKL